jgi:hypothetical protein
MRRVLMVTVILLGAPAAAAGQTAWDAPLLLPPRPADGVGIFLTDMHAGGIGVLGTWRSPVWNYGLRAGISEGPGDDIALFGGVDYMGPVNTATTDFPVDVDWVLGVGLGISDGIRISVPLGLTGAHSFQAEGARFTPYLTPRVVLDAWFGADERSDNLGLGVALDLGLDLRFTSAGGALNGMTVRFGAAIGDRNAVGIGLVF